jgi:hypothetical protein
MSIEKALKAKNSGVFVENIQAAYLKRSTGEILDAIQNAPFLKWAHEMEIIKFGLMSWCEDNYASELKSKIVQSIDADEFRPAMIGCLFLFGMNENKTAIELSETIFEKAESSSDYEFYASAALSVLISCSIEWKGAPNGKYYIAVDKGYLSSTVTSVTDDFRQSDTLYNESRIVELSMGFSRAGQQERSKELLNEYLTSLSEYSDIESLIYSLTKTIEGMPANSRSVEVTPCDFVNTDFVEICLSKAKEISEKSDEESLNELSQYVKDY